MTEEECLAKAVEAEQLASLVSLRTDKEQLRRSAQQWRDRAARSGASDRYGQARTNSPNRGRQDLDAPLR